MSESASPIGLREQRKEETRRSLTSLARRLTAERGLNGFTLEELCAEVGVSRRTFFNYFPAKEAAIVGHTDDFLDEVAVQRFFDARPASVVGISPNLVRDLAQLGLAHMDFVDETPAQRRDFMAAVTREPQLIQAFLSMSAERERQLTSLVAQRERVAANDPAAQIAVAVVGVLFKSSVDRFFEPDNTEPLDSLLETSIDAAERLFRATDAPSTPEPSKDKQ